MSQDILGGSLPDDDEIDHDKTNTFKPLLPQIADTDVLSLIKKSGDEDLQVQLRALVMSCWPHQLKLQNFL